MMRGETLGSRDSVGARAYRGYRADAAPEVHQRAARARSLRSTITGTRQPPRRAARAIRAEFRRDESRLAARTRNHPTAYAREPPRCESAAHRERDMAS